MSEWRSPIQEQFHRLAFDRSVNRIRSNHRVRRVLVRFAEWAEFFRDIRPATAISECPVAIVPPQTATLTVIAGIPVRVSVSVKSAPGCAKALGGIYANACRYCDIVTCNPSEYGVARPTDEQCLAYQWTDLIGTPRAGGITHVQPPGNVDGA
jgi:hypothetical protein